MSWKDFEKLIAQIYSELSPQAKVTHNDKIRGVDSKTDRQIDVSIRFNIAGHSILTVIQAKDYRKTTADINDVGEFASVIKDIRANKGILICRSGFTQGAMDLAKNLGIDLCNIHDAKSRDWSLEITLPILWIDLLPIVQFQIAVNFKEGDSISKNPDHWTISTDKGETRLTLIDSFIKAWNQGAIPRDVGVLHNLVDPNLIDPEILIEDINGEIDWRSVFDLAVTYKVSQQSWLGSLSPEECRGVFNYTNETFTVSYLDLGVIPTERDESWVKVDDPNQLAVSVSSHLITTERSQVDRESSHIGEPSLKKIDPDEKLQ